MDYYPIQEGRKNLPIYSFHVAETGLEADGEADLQLTIYHRFLSCILFLVDFLIIMTCLHHNGLKKAVRRG